jgi:hypothetical protein
MFSGYYFKTQPIWLGRPRDPNHLHVNFQYFTSRMNICAANFATNPNRASYEARASIVRECFEEHIKKGFPYDEYYLLDELAGHYGILAKQVDINIPAALREEIITTLLEQTDFYNYFHPDGNQQECIFKLVTLNIETLIELFHLLDARSQQLLLRNTILFLENVYTQVSGFKKHPQYEEYKESAYELLKKIKEKINDPYDFEKRCIKYLENLPYMEMIHRSTGLITKLDFAFYKLKDAQAAFNNPQLAFQLYSQIPYWAVKEFGEAQYCMANLQRDHGEYAISRQPQTDEIKKQRLLLMKPHLEAAASAGHVLAIADKNLVCEQLEKLTPQVSLGIFSQPSHSVSPIITNNLESGRPRSYSLSPKFRTQGFS